MKVRQRTLVTCRPSARYTRAPQGGNVYRQRRVQVITRGRGATVRPLQPHAGLLSKLEDCDIDRDITRTIY